MKRMTIPFLMILLPVFALAACAGEAVSDEDTVLSVGEIEVAEPESASDADVQADAQLDPTTAVVPTEVSVDSEMPEDDPEPEREEVAVEQPAPVLKTVLEASDPSAVSLASGKTQLIELFAYW